MTDFVDNDSLIWTVPGRGSADSMPLGNGEIGLNVWTESNGDLVFYIARTDAWNENSRLLKLGRIRVSLDPPADFSGEFRQTLCLSEATIEVRAGEGLRLRVWVDSNAPVIRVEMTSAIPRRMSAALEIWREKNRVLDGGERHSAYGLHGYAEDIVESPDLVLDGGGDRVVWCHRNERSMWPRSVALQGLADMEVGSDPLLYRTFGGALLGEGFIRSEGMTVISSLEPWSTLEIHTLTAQTETLEEWNSNLFTQIETAQRVPLEAARAAHLKWWREFWERSYIRVSGSEAAEIVSRGYALQRFISACAGRGNFPIKFNGSLFTVDMADHGLGGNSGVNPPIYDADYRRWGGPYWFQNTRLTYWPMLAAGDFEMMRPFFGMYIEALPLATARTRVYYDHPGACYPETMTFWGGHSDSDFGLDRNGLAVSHCVNQYIRYYWQGGLELCEMALEYFRHTGDGEFLRGTALPLATAILAFYAGHYGRDAEGKLVMEPAQSLETWWDVVNPTPDVAGLWSVLEGLLALPEGLVPEGLRLDWRRMLEELPEVPLREGPGGEVIAAADVVRGEIKNVENPELYAVFPYRRFGLGLPDLEVARRSFQVRRFPETGGWQQNSIQAAVLGLTEEARDMVVENFTNSHPGSRFPAFWGPNYDWVPDQDHGGVAMMALQTMLLQHDAERLFLLPAWPREWNVQFKLHAPGGTTIEGDFHGGQLHDLQVFPPESRQRLEICQP